MTRSGEWVLAFGGASHDFSAAFMEGTDIKVAIEAERVTRVKYGKPTSFEDPVERCARYCMDAAGVDRSDVTRVVATDPFPCRALARWPVHRLYDHHLSHAASAVMLLPRDTRACVLVYDGAGSIRRREERSGMRTLESQTFSFFEFVDNQLQCLGTTYGSGYDELVQIPSPVENSLGQLYELVSSAIGFGQLEVGKTMGLAAWGVPRFLETFHEYIEFGWTFDAVFRCDTADVGFLELVEKALSDERHSFSVRADLAATVQAVLTAALLHCYELLAPRDFDVFCIAGGCALNTMANGVLTTKLPAGRRLLVPPHAGDAGLGLGALWLYAQERASEPVTLTLRGASLMPHVARPGRTYAEAAIRPLAGRQLPRLAIDSSVSGPADLAARLASGQVIGLFNGGSEIGPRALGGRSLIADPRRSGMRERLNRAIKRREPFRPLAPLVLAEHFDDYFWPPAAADPFMLVVAQTHERCRGAAPAVVHVDGTARVQVVFDESDPFLSRLLREFLALTGVPILLNTSFNRRGEPIVETPADAIDAALAMELDGLYLQGLYLTPVAAAV